MTTPTRPYKAAIAFVLAFLVAFYATVQGQTDIDTMGWEDWLIVVVGALVTAGGVYQVSNPPVNPPAPQHLAEPPPPVE